MGMKKTQQKKPLCGELRAFTWRRECLTLQSCKFEVRLLLTASTWSLPQGAATISETLGIDCGQTQASGLKTGTEVVWY